MKIGLVIHALDPALGGAEQWTWQFARWLVAAGHEVHVVAGRFCQEAAGAGLVCHALPRVSSRYALAEAAEAELRRLKLDVIHDMGLGWRCDVFQPHGGSRRAAFEQNLLLAPRWLRPLKRLAAGALPRYREFERIAARQYAPDGRKIIALSRMVAEHMRRLHGVDDSALRLVYNGVDTERFHPRDRERFRGPVRRELGLSDELLALVVAHNFRLKGVPALIRSVARLRREGTPVHLAVVGGKRLGRWRRFTRRLNVEPNVTFLGSRTNVAEYYAAADVYVQPTLYDPCSLVVLEALASGTPVITSRFNGAGELITPGVEGLVLEAPTDVGALSAAIARLADLQTRDRMSLAARRLAERHTLDYNCREILALYEEIADGALGRAA